MRNLQEQMQLLATLNLFLFLLFTFILIEQIQCAPLSPCLAFESGTSFERLDREIVACVRPNDTYDSRKNQLDAQAPRALVRSQVVALTSEPILKANTSPLFLFLLRVFASFIGRTQIGLWKKFALLCSSFEPNRQTDGLKDKSFRGSFYRFPSHTRLYRADFVASKLRFERSRNERVVQLRSIGALSRAERQQRGQEEPAEADAIASTAAAAAATSLLWPTLKTYLV